MTTYKKPSDVMEAVGVSGVLSAGLTWHVVGEGLAWAKFDKPADAVRFTMTKRGKGRKFAVMTFTPGKEFSGVVYLTSVKRGLDAGQVITDGQLLDLYHGNEKKAAEKPAGLVEAAGELQAEIISLYGYPVAFNGVSITTKEEDFGKFFQSLDLEQAEKYSTQKTPISAVFSLQDMEPAEIDFKKLKDTATIRDTAKNVFLLTESIKAVQRPVTAEKFRAAKNAIEAGQFDAAELAKLATKAASRNPRAKRALKDGLAALLKHSKLLLKEFKEEHESKRDETRYLGIATWLLAGLSLSARRLLKKTPTTQKRQKSKSRARLEASRAAIKTVDTQAADFKVFCKKINAGRQVPYSERNCALLYVQSNGKATEVRGFRSWKAAGRVVKKGSKALAIEAPKIIKGTDKNGKEFKKMICTLVCVFDVSQTEILKENKGA